VFTGVGLQWVSPFAIPVCVAGGGALRYCDLGGVGSSGSAALVLASASGSISAGEGFRVGPLKVFRVPGSCLRYSTLMHSGDILHSLSERSLKALHKKHGGRGLHRVVPTGTQTYHYF
jgi:hypothetical protein